ncbi:MAG: hypothetical protein GY850_17760 [bacterium]|nr:hypothetical protein [bacterium]
MINTNPAFYRWISAGIQEVRIILMLHQSNSRTWILETAGVNSIYRMISGSVGLQIGGQAKDIIIAFMSNAALNKFRQSKGWEAGVDGNIALITVGAGERSSSAMAKQPFAAFVFDVKGLMAGMSLKGAKFKKLDKSKVD